MSTLFTKLSESINITTMGKETIGTLLKAYHVERIKQAGEVITQSQLAEEFDIDFSLFNKYYNDQRQRPDGENKRKLAAKLGDVVYEVLGEKPPHPTLRILEAIAERNDPNDQELWDLIDRLIADRGGIVSKDTG